MVALTSASFAMDSEQDDFDTTSLLKELLEISNRSATSRFSKKTFHSLTTTKLKTIDSEGNADQAQLFLEETPEDSSLNQYWFSESSIKILCEAITKALATYNKQKVAFLSTPSLYFAMPADIRKNCTLFEVSQIKGFITIMYVDLYLHFSTNLILLV